MIMYHSYSKMNIKLFKKQCAAPECTTIDHWSNGAAAKELQMLHHQPNPARTRPGCHLRWNVRMENNKTQ